eukprot:SAG31_NODE_1133_length_9745_cov_5.676343_11_plen_75_part_00
MLSSTWRPAGSVNGARSTVPLHPESTFLRRVSGFEGVGTSTVRRMRTVAASKTLGRSAQGAAARSLLLSEPVYQ